MGQDIFCHHGPSTNPLGNKMVEKIEGSKSYQMSQASWANKVFII